MGVDWDRLLRAARRSRVCAMCRCDLNPAQPTTAAFCSRPAPCGSRFRARRRYAEDPEGERARAKARYQARRGRKQGDDRETGS